VSITSSQEAVNGSINVNMDPTVPAPMINVAEYGFEGRFEDWADDARYFEYSQAANPIGSGFTPKVPVVRFSPEIYVDEPTGIVPLDLSKELGITTGEANSRGTEPCSTPELNHAPTPTCAPNWDFTSDLGGGDRRRTDQLEFAEDGCDCHERLRRVDRSFVAGERRA